MPPGTLADAELIEQANVEDEPEENAAVESVVGLGGWAATDDLERPVDEAELQDESPRLSVAHS